MTFVLDVKGEPTTLKALGAAFARKSEAPRTSSQR
jgi:hypothetical protein